MEASCTFAVPPVVALTVVCCGSQIVALANLMPADDSVDELDSYMYQTVILFIHPTFLSLSILLILSNQDVISRFTLLGGELSMFLLDGMNLHS